MDCRRTLRRTPDDILSPRNFKASHNAAFIDGLNGTAHACNEICWSAICPARPNTWEYANANLPRRDWASFFSSLAEVKMPSISWDNSSLRFWVLSKTRSPLHVPSSLNNAPKAAISWEKQSALGPEVSYGQPINCRRRLTQDSKLLDNSGFDIKMKSWFCCKPLHAPSTPNESVDCHLRSRGQTDLSERMRLLRRRVVHSICTTVDMRNWGLTTVPPTS